MKFRLEQISFSYRPKSSPPRSVFAELDLVVEKGECVGVIGPEGSGKTTLLQLMDALLWPDQGKVLIDGIDAWDRPERLHELRRRIGFAFQFPEQQFFCETVRDELMYASRNYRVNGGHNRGEDLLTEFGLTSPDFLDRSPFTLSIGEARRVAISSILMMRPSALLLDEPTVGLDGSGIDQVLSSLGRLRNEGVTIVIVSHDVNALAEIVSRVIVLNDGIREDLPARVLLSDKERLGRHGYDTPEVVCYADELRQQGYVVEDGIITVDALKQALRQQR